MVQFVKPFRKSAIFYQIWGTSVSQVLYPITPTDTEKMRPDMKILKTESTTLIDPPASKKFLSSEMFAVIEISEGFYLQLNIKSKKSHI
mgnify:CR=1 FL=1